MIELKRQKEIIFSTIKDVFEKNGFEFIKGLPPKYVKKSDGIIYSMNFDFSSKTHSSFASNSMIYISIDLVENIILEIGFLNSNLDAIKQGKYWSNTVLDKKNQLEFNHGNPSNTSLKTEEDFQKWGKAIVSYIESDGLEFMKHYSYLPNIQNKLVELERENKYWIELLNGRVDNIFRGLIIYKLCNNDDYDRVLNKWKDKIMTNIKYERWHPHMLKLEEILKNTSPIYNV